MASSLAKLNVRGSRFAERVALTEGRAELPLARAEVRELEARAWRVTLGRAERTDALPANAIDSKLFSSQLYPYAAGSNFAAPNPPRRNHPVAGNGTDVNPIFVQLAWGMGSASVQRMIAHWPMQGASLVVVGSFVEVFAAALLIGPDSLPLLQASIAPDEAGGATPDANELSLTQDTTVIPLATDYAAYVPDYARRLRVVGTVDTEAVPTFQPRVFVRWYNDLGQLIDMSVQGTSIGVTAEFLAVPAGATMVNIGALGPNLDCNEPLYNDVTLYLHWRLAP